MSTQSAYGELNATQAAGFWRRLAAYIVDSVLISVIGGAIGGIIAGIVHSSNAQVFTALVSLIFGLVYFGQLWSRDGQSLGYRLLRIRLVRTNGERVSFGFGMARFLLIYVSIALFLVPAIISAFMIGMGPRKQAIHDAILGTLVVPVEAGIAHNGVGR